MIMLGMASVIGVSVPRVEGLQKVTGAGGYTADVLLPGTLWGKVLRSIEPHARLLKVDASRARALPGVRAVLTGADLGLMMSGTFLRDWPVLAVDRVRLVGDPIAVVAADEPDVAEAALDLIDVEYESLPAVFDPVSALAADAPILHPDRLSYTGGPAEAPTHLNMQGQSGFTKGDVEQGFAESDRIFENEFVVGRQHQGYLEPRACLVNIEDDGTVRVWSTTKARYRLRNLLASLFDLEQEKVVLEPVNLGGDFGGKGAIGHEPLAYALARATGRPVRIIRSYAEELMTGNPRHGFVIRTKTGVKNDGTLVARQVEMFIDGGAYCAPKASPTLTIPSVMRVMGPYRIPHTKLEARFAYTNNPPGGSMRAPGQPQVVFAGESEMDIIAGELGLDPLAFRLKNVLNDGEEWPNGTRYEQVPSRAALELARGASQWDQPLPPWHGRGIAISERGIGSGPTGVELTLHEDGHATAMNGTPDMGAGAYTVLRQIVADQLHLPLEAVTVLTGNTNQTLMDSGTGGSKSTYSLTAAAMACAVPLNAALSKLAAEQLECAVDDLEPTDSGYQVKGSPSRVVPTTRLIAEAVARSGGPLRSESPGPEKAAPELSAQVVVAEVEVDPETGQVTPRRIILANDVGTQINPRLLEGQIEGGAIQGLGMALMENLLGPEGRAETFNLGDYKMPLMADVPELVNVYLEGMAGPLAYQAKAVGEHAVIPMGAAIANAVAAATGVRVRTMPLSAEQVLAGLRP